MRGAAALAVLLVACLPRSGTIDDPGPGSDPFGGPSGNGGGAGVRCNFDTNCDPGLLCARSHSCTPPDELRVVHARWTVRGMPAGQVACAAAPSLTITFLAPGGVGERMTYAPVPCAEGVFTIDKLPVSYNEVQLGKDSGGPPASANVDAMTGEAALDLQY
jgi:hypothetical protein